MEIKNRLFPYPVLCMENDDYIDCEFNIKFNQVEELKEIVLQFEVELIIGTNSSRRSRIHSPY